MGHSRYIVNATRLRYVEVPSYDARTTLEIVLSVGWLAGVEDIFIERKVFADTTWLRLCCPASSVKKRSWECSNQREVANSFNNHRDSVSCS